jgi:hypothetical protein
MVSYSNGDRAEVGRHRHLHTHMLSLVKQLLGHSVVFLSRRLRCEAERRLPKKGCQNRCRSLRSRKTKQRLTELLRFSLANNAATHV